MLTKEETEAIHTAFLKVGNAFADLLDEFGHLIEGDLLDKENGSMTLDALERIDGLLLLVHQDIDLGFPSQQDAMGILKEHYPELHEHVVDLMEFVAKDQDGEIPDTIPESWLEPVFDAGDPEELPDATPEH